MTTGLGGLNKSPNGVVLGLVQLQLPVVDTPDQLVTQTARVVEMVGKARRNNPARAVRLAASRSQSTYPLHAGSMLLRAGDSVVVRLFTTHVGGIEGF